MTREMQRLLAEQWADRRTDRKRSLLRWQELREHFLHETEHLIEADDPRAGWEQFETSLQQADEWEAEAEARLERWP